MLPLGLFIVFFFWIFAYIFTSEPLRVARVTASGIYAFTILIIMLPLEYVTENPLASGTLALSTTTQEQLLVVNVFLLLYALVKDWTYVQASERTYTGRKRRK